MWFPSPSDTHFSPVSNSDCLSFTAISLVSQSNCVEGNSISLRQLGKWGHSFYLNCGTVRPAASAFNWQGPELLYNEGSIFIQDIYGLLSRRWMEKHTFMPQPAGTNIIFKVNRNNRGSIFTFRSNLGCFSPRSCGVDWSSRLIYVHLIWAQNFHNYGALVTDWQCLSFHFLFIQRRFHHLRLYGVECSFNDAVGDIETTWRRMFNECEAD